MTEVKTKIAQKTATKNSPPVSSKQKAQNTQAGGPTIGGVAGVGKQKTVTRPKSSQSTKTPSPHGVRTGPIGEAVHDDAWFHKKAAETAKGMGWPAHLVPRIKANMIKDHAADKAARAAKRAVKEGKESEFGANRMMTKTVRGTMAKKLEPKHGMSDYYAHNAKKTNVVKEDGGGAPAMSVAGGAVPSITNPTVNYAFQVKNKMKGKLARRKKPA